MYSQWCSKIFSYLRITTQSSLYLSNHSELGKKFSRTSTIMKFTYHIHNSPCLHWIKIWTRLKHRSVRHKTFEVSTFLREIKKKPCSFHSNCYKNTKSWFMILRMCMNIELNKDNHGLIIFSTGLFVTSKTTFKLICTTPDFCNWLEKINEICSLFKIKNKL